MLREEHRLRAFWIRMLRITFGFLREEATRGRRKLHSMDFYSLHEILLRLSNQGGR
jgi:hypothetical protein